MESNVEDILENRIAEAERKIFGYQKKSSIQDPLPETNIVDSLSRINTYVSTALSGRDKFNILNQKLPEIEQYLEVDADLIDLQTEAKLEYILSLESVIRDIVQQYNKLEKFMPLINNNDTLKNIPEMSEKLQSLTVDYVKLSEEAEQVNAETKEILSRYNDIIINISKTLLVLDEEVTKLEEAAKPKKIED